jgi:hypothetical protein
MATKGSGVGISRKAGPTPIEMESIPLPMMDVAWAAQNAVVSALTPEFEKLSGSPDDLVRVRRLVLTATSLLIERLFLGSTELEERFEG